MKLSHSFIILINPLLIALLCLLVTLGYKKGFLSKILSCLSFIVVAFISWQIAPILSQTFKWLPVSYAPYQDSMMADFFYQYANQIFIFIVLILVASICIFLLKPILLLVQKLPVISFTNSVLGAILGVGEMFLVCMALSLVLHSPLVVNGSEVINQTIFFKFEKIQKEVFIWGNEYLNDIDVLNQTAFDESKAEKLKELLNEHGYSDEQIQQFLKELGK